MQRHPAIANQVVDLGVRSGGCVRTSHRQLGLSATGRASKKNLPSAPVPLVLASLIALRRMLTGMMTANVKGTLAIAEAAATARTACTPKKRFREHKARSGVSLGSLFREPQSKE